MSTLRRRLMMAAEKSPIPSEYQLVEYLGSAGIQYINTESFPVLPTGFEIEYSINPNNNENAIFGASTSNSYLQGTNYVIDRSGNTQFAYLGGNNYRTYAFLGVNVKHNLKFNVTGSDYTMYLNDSAIFGMNVVSVPPLSLFLFGRNVNGGLSTITPFVGKIYKFKLLNMGVTEKDLYPVYRKSDSKPGMYDLVNNVFYTNQGTGEFAIGPDTTWQG